MMTVLYKNQLFKLDYDYDLFQNLKRTNPNLRVKVSPVSDSTYTYDEEIELKDLEDWSVARNLSALGQN